MAVQLVETFLTYSHHVVQLLVSHLAEEIRASGTEHFTATPRDASTARNTGLHADYSTIVMHLLSSQGCKILGQYEWMDASMGSFQGLICTWDILRWLASFQAFHRLIYTLRHIKLHTHTFWRPEDRGVKKYMFVAGPEFKSTENITQSPHVHTYHMYIHT